ncbi:MAG: hypothetical protein Q4C01_07410 [Clostridia bacterium]|nr:hypothetical protein [Clostridia bacterium]
MSKIKWLLKQTDRYFWGMVVGVTLQIIAFFTIGNLSSDAAVVWCEFDNSIPIIPIFVIPYLLWFPYIAAGLLTFWYGHKKSRADHGEFCRLMWLLGIGLLYCAIFYIVFPMRIPYGVRPDVADKTGLLAWLLRLTYNNNVANNALPSEHCYVSMMLCWGFLRMPYLKKSRHRFWVYPASILLTLSIIGATVFIKQHSILDFFAAIALFAAVLAIVYLLPWGKKGEADETAD